VVGGTGCLVADPDLEIEKLTVVAATYLRASAWRLVLAGVLEDPTVRPAYVHAVGVTWVVCRLQVDLAVVRRRLGHRHEGQPVDLAWRLLRSGELDAILRSVHAEDFTIDATDLTPFQTATAAVRAAGWNEDPRCSSQVAYPRCPTDPSRAGSLARHLSRRTATPRTGRAASWWSTTRPGSHRCLMPDRTDGLRWLAAGRHWRMPVDEEHVLAGGNVADAVVRVGQTVRKPRTAATPAVTALLHHLTSVGFEASPRHLGLDDIGRQVLEFVPGVNAYSQPPLTVPELTRLGGMIRRLHDATQTLTPSPAARWDVAIPADRDELVCHHDLAPWNLIRDGHRWVFIDWDGAGPGSRLWDLGYAAHGFIPLQPGGDPDHDGPRLRALADGYGLDQTQRRDLPALTAAHTRGMYDLLRNGHRTGTQPWARLWAQGHGAHWGPAADYIHNNLHRWTTALGA
jgi:hypothetical protein